MVIGMTLKVLQQNLLNFITLYLTYIHDKHFDNILCLIKNMLNYSKFMLNFQFLSVVNCVQFDKKFKIFHVNDE